MMGTSGSPSAIVGFLDGMSAMAKLLADPAALAKLRDELALAVDVADKKVAAATDLSVKAAAQAKEAESKLADAASRQVALDQREQELAQSENDLAVKIAASQKEMADVRAELNARDNELKERHADLEKRAASINTIVSEAFKAREIELARRETAVAEKENILEKAIEQETAAAARLKELEERETQARAIIEKAAALTAMISGTAI